MSDWTYVNGIIQVDTMAKTTAQAIFIANTVIDHLPAITGSEGDVSYYTISPKGYNCSSNADEFNQFSNLKYRNYNRLFNYKSNVLIVLNGQLRDRSFDKTLKETSKVLSRLSVRLYIVECLVSVCSYGKNFVFNNPDYLTRDLSNSEDDWMNKLRDLF